MNVPARGWHAVISADTSNLTLFAPHFCQHISENQIEVIFDGYLFDQREWMQHFQLEDGAALDARVLLHAYRQWGSESFQHLDGAFCALILDTERGQLLAGHDALGKHPLYYARVGSKLYFASNLFALADDPAIPRQADRGLLALRLMGIWPPVGRTPFAAISRLAPGHYLRYHPQADTLQTTCFWSPLPEADEDYLAPEEALARFEPEFQAAVARCMRRNPTGMLLSGGIDSVSVALMATRFTETSSPLIACSGRISSVAPLNYEEHTQIQAATLLGMPHLVFGDDVTLRTIDLVQDSAAIGTVFPFPANMWWSAATVALYRAVAERGLRVLLTGSGGDEWLGVHYAYAADLLRRLDAIGFFSLLQATADTGGEGWRPALRTLFWEYGLRLLLRSFWMRVHPARREAHLRQQISSHLPPWLLPDHALREEVVALRATLRPPDLTNDGRFPPSFYRHHLQGQFANFALTSQFELDHALNAHLGIERLSPFHDRQFVHFLNRISPRTLLTGNRYKGLLRPFVTRELPALDLHRQRKLYTSDSLVPLEQALLTTLRPAAANIGAQSCEALGLVDARVFARTVLETPDDVSRLASLSGVLSMESWLSAHPLS
jgi:asparagine synthase (glutamine-hydrolysing)